MNILYGLAGEGFGHSSRALLLIPYLKSKGHNVKVITYGQSYEVLKNKFEIMKVHGLHLIFKKGILKKRDTWDFNAKNFPKNLNNWKQFYDLINNFKPNLIITDMEPITPMLSNWFNVPLISIDNQHRITNLELDIPKKYMKDYLLAKTIVNLFCRKADDYIISSFSDTKILKEGTFIVPPIIREEIKNLKPNSEGKILVYLSKNDSNTLSTLKKIPENFAVYGLGLKNNSKNLEFKSKDTFLKDLEKCKAIIATAGFSLMSEAIYLKKPYLALPLKGQFEQMLNALFLKQAKFGDYSEKLRKTEVITFLNNLKNYEKNLKEYNPNYNKIFSTLNKLLKKVENPKITCKE